ncbi:MAG: prepilin-type N-terminal cleavage/methylation domain-containing protein [Pseudomonadota bacterium]|nr:prepilin-type N-terminal cleavage/methylation domain-containing protein [Pseudomonadota bacterium]
MQVKNLQTQKGFTLVEIAIVLVIIGLLLGGVLKGQEMITAAKIKNDTDSLVGMQAAAYAYRDRMGYYPGTDRSAAPATVTANKTQMVASDTNSDKALVAAQANIGDLFIDLTLQGFLKDANVSPSTDEDGGYSSGYGLLARGGLSTATVPVEVNQNYICINYTAGIDNGAEILRGMDIKLDDGDGTTGKFRFDELGAGVAATGCFEI